MALTQIRGDQIQNRQLHDRHMMFKTDAGGYGGVKYDKLNLDNSLVATDLDASKSVHQAVLDSHLLALWDVATAQTVSGTSVNVTSVVAGAANTDTATKAGTQKGVLTTGTGTNGAGVENYRVQLRTSTSKDTIPDNLGGVVYGELTNDSIGGGVTGQYTLTFKKSDGSAYQMAQSEVTKITTTKDEQVEVYPTGTAIPTYFQKLNGKYFRISSPTTDYYVWYHVSGQTAADPASQNVGKTGIPVVIAANADAISVATATASALNTVPAFAASSSLNAVTVTSNAAGLVTTPEDGVGGFETGFNVQVLTAGTPTQIDFMFSEVYSYLTAPYSAFITGMGFADVVGISGVHNHNDLYYTKVELESGQLDDRYFTQSQLIGGQLDNRYYTETEVDPIPGTDGGSAKLDTRYYRKSEISSTASGSSGGTLVGITPVGTLNSTNVQSALVELQTDIDNIISGAANINHSLDEAYNDGSVVAVDTTNVDWQLSDTKKFVISADASGATELFKVEAQPAGDTLSVNAKTTVTGDFKQTGKFEVVSTTASVASAGAVTVTGAAIAVEGTAASHLRTTGANLTVETQTSGALAVNSAGALTLKDSNLAVGLPVSQVGISALSIHLDTGTSIVGAINENTDDLYTLIHSTLPSTVDGASGADQVGATGIAGVIPTGGTLGSSATVQDMLEGVARSSGGNKSFPTLGTAVDGTETGDITAAGSLLAEKSHGMYFKTNEIVFVRDISRFLVIKTQGLGVTTGVDWDYIWGNALPLAGPNFKVTADQVAVDTVGGFSVSTDQGFSIVDDSGASVAATSAGAVDVQASAGQEVHIVSTEKVLVNGGNQAQVAATAITLTGALTATGATNDHQTINASGTGQIHVNSNDEIDLNAPLIDVHGHIMVQSNKAIYVDKINITSVDPSDYANISGERGGTPNPINLLQNGGFEQGAGSTAASWTEGVNTTRSSTDKFYNSYAIHVKNIVAAVAGTELVVKQALTALVSGGQYVVSVYAKGANQSPVQVSLGGGTPVVLIPGGDNPAIWERFDVVVSNGAVTSGDLLVELLNTTGAYNDFFLDAIMLEHKSATPASDYFTTYFSNLVFTVGDEDDDTIIFRSEGTTSRDLITISQNDVHIDGNLFVKGTTTNIDTQNLLVTDNDIILNSNVISGTPSLDAYYAVSRGNAHRAELKWNETLDKWELWNQQSNQYETLMSSSTGDVTVTMDTAYNGGSDVNVDATNVNFLLQATKKFVLGDTVDATKFVVTAGNAANSINIDTHGGVAIAVDDAFTVDSLSGAELHVAAAGSVLVRGAAGQDVDFGTAGGAQKVLLGSSKVLVSNGNGTAADAVEINSVNGGVKIVAALTKPVAITTGAFTVDAVLASQIGVTGADLTLKTTTSGSVAVSAAAALTFKDQYQTAALAFSQTNADGLAAQFAYNSQTDFSWTVRATGTAPITSLVAAANANRQDLYEYVELLSTKGAVFGVAAGANLIGVKGIVGVKPTGGNLGDNANLQAVLEGLALSAGGGKTFATIAAFKAAKAAGSYFKADEHVHILDVNRIVRVLVQGVAVNEGIDWTYIAGTETAGVTSQVIGGEAYKYVLTGTGVDSFKVQTTGGIKLDAAKFALATTGTAAVTAAGQLNITTTGSNDIVVVSGANFSVNGQTLGLTGALFNVTSAGAITATAGASSSVAVTGGNLDLKTLTTGDVNVTAASNINLTANVVKSDVTTFDVNATTFTIDGTAASTIKVTGANLNLQTASSGEIAFKDARMVAGVPLTDAVNPALDFDPTKGAPASIFDAINRAYNNIGDVSKAAYFESTISDVDAVNDYVQLSGTGHDGLVVIGNETYDLPGGASNLVVTPQALRNTYGIYLALYLNGLRLSDSEWVYVYDQASGKKVVSFDTDYTGKEARYQVGGDLHTGTTPADADAPFSWLSTGGWAKPVDNVVLVASDKLFVDATYTKSFNY
jgi:hypothetical protein